VSQILYSGLGGHGGVVFAMIAADRGRRWEHVLGFLGIEQLLPTWRDRCADAGIECSYLPAIARRPWRSWPKVLRWLNRTVPDAIVLHSPAAILPCAIYAWRKRVPLMVVEHQNNQLKGRQDWLASLLAMRFADRVIMLTPAYRREMKASLGSGFRDDKARVIANGIDTDFFSPLLAPRQLGPIRLGMAARLAGSKRFDLLMDTVELMTQRGASVRFSLAGTGDGWEGLTAEVARRGLSDCFDLPGMLTGQALVDWYRSLDLYVHATDGETLSISIIQAMASGVPVVASAVPGVTELVKDGRGIGVAPQSAAAFADAIGMVIADPNRMSAVSDAARAYIVRNFDQNVMFSAYADEIEALIAENARP
jgi:glycosyltransferase involved in cell wall biosynthesis